MEWLAIVLVVGISVFVVYEVVTLVKAIKNRKNKRRSDGNASKGEDAPNNEEKGE